MSAAQTANQTFYQRCRSDHNEAAEAAASSKTFARDQSAGAMVKALVLGATGHLGNAITRELIARGYDVTAIGRRAEPPVNLSGLALAYLRGDLDNAGELERAVEGHDVVVDAAAPYPSVLAPTAARAADVLEHARRRTQRLVDAVLRQRARLAYVSSFTTLPDASTGFERLLRQWIRQLHPYFAVKQLIETEILAAAQQGLRAVVVNPTLCIGPWDLKPRELCFVPRLLCGEAPATVTHAVNVIDVRDMAAGLVAALEAGYYGDPIPLTGHNLSVETLYTWLCELGGVAPPWIVAPLTLAVLAAYCSEITLGAVGLRPPLPALAPMLTMLHDSFDTGRVQAQLGIAPRPLSATLADAIEWYRRIGYC
jgi:dihydroflavonol-4-reductase